jgi:hypothetical protein
MLVRFTEPNCLNEPPASACYDSQHDSGLHDAETMLPTSDDLKALPNQENHHHTGTDERSCSRKVNAGTR